MFYRQGDYYRYLAEFKTKDRDQVSNKSLEAYKIAQDIAKEDLASTHPIRLGI